jgi:iron complex outermembrane receptor protein
MTERTKQPQSSSPHRSSSRRQRASITTLVAALSAPHGAIAQSILQTSPSPPVIVAQSATPAAEQTSAIPAAQGAGAGLDEIVVTAERRSESLQSTPIAISAVSGDALQERQIVDLEGLSNQIPNVEFGRNAGDAYIFIRGLGYDSIAPGGETRVAVYTDSIYQPRTQAAFQGFYDVDRVEVLRGPQGTLYGRNATAGAVNILTRDPSSELDGYVTGRVGDYSLVGSEGAIGGPLSETLSARLAFQTEDHSGYGHNIDSGEDVDDKRARNVRLKLKYAPSTNFSFGLVTNYGMEKDHSGGYRYVGAGRPDVVPTGLTLGGAVPTDPQDAAGFGPRLDLETYGVSGEARWALGPSTELVSLTGYQNLTAKNEDSVDGTTLNLAPQQLVDQSKSISQELRLSHAFGEVADTLLGGYYFHENSFSENKIPFSAGLFGGLAADYFQAYWTQGRVITNAYAAFNETRIHFLPQLTLTLGGRYSHEKKSIDEGAELDLVDAYDPNRPFEPNGTQQASTTESRFDPKATLAYQPSDSLYLYGTYSQGFKSGGFNIGGLQPAFKPEVVDDYEAGMKLDVLERRLRFDVAVFHYNYRNLQVNIVDGVQLVTRNAAAAKVDGAEFEITALPVDNLRLALNASYLDSRYTAFISTNPVFPELGPQYLDGHRLNYAPLGKVNGEVGYSIPINGGKLTPRVDVTWVDRVFFSEFNLPSTSQAAWTNVDAFLAYESTNGLWSASAFIKNLTDHTYVVSAVVSSPLIGFPITGEYGAPRTYGMSLTRRF